MSKTWKVAQREFAENARTKSFWIGIFSFPVILFLVIFVPTWLREKVDVRKYAVHDESGWLLREIDARTRFPDLLQMYADQKAGVPIPPAVRETRLWQAVSEVPTDELREQLVDGMRRIYAMSEGELESKIAQARALLPAGILTKLEEGKEQLRILREEVPRIFSALDALENHERAQSWISSSRTDRFERVDVEGGVDTMQSMLDAGQLFAYFVIGSDPVEDDQGCLYFSDNSTDTALKDWLSSRATEIVRERRIAALDLDTEQAAWLNDPVTFSHKQIDAVTGEVASVGDAQKLRQWAPAGFVYALWIAVFVIAQMLLTNTIEEKSNRIIEVLLSSVSPLQLMTGKIVGIALTGLTMIGSWLVFFALGILGAPLVEPSLEGILTKLGLVDIATDPLYLGSFVVYFALGYVLYASLLVGIGSVCNTLKEAQNLMQPVMIVLMLPLLAMIPIASDPNGLLARVLSFVPPLTPFIMMNRVGGPPELWEYVLTTILLVVTILVTFRAAAKVFRIGILMTGKRPSVKEIFRWMRAPIGTMPAARQ